MLDMKKNTIGREIPPGDQMGRDGDVHARRHGVPELLAPRRRRGAALSKGPRPGEGKGDVEAASGVCMCVRAWAWLHVAARVSE